MKNFPFIKFIKELAVAMWDTPPKPSAAFNRTEAENPERYGIVVPGAFGGLF